MPKFFARTVDNHVFRAVSCLIAWLILTLGLTTYVGPYIITHLVNNEPFDMAPERLWLKVGVLTTLFVIGLGLAVSTLLVCWEALRAAFWIMVVCLILIGQDIARGVDAYTRTTFADSGWSIAQISTFVAVFSVWGVITSVWMLPDALSQPSRAASRTKDRSAHESRHYHVTLINLKGVRKPDGRLPPHLRSGWIARRVLEGFGFGIALSLVYLWIRPEVSLSREVLIIWTCLAGGTIGGVALGVLFGSFRLAGHGYQPRVASEIGLVLAIGTYSTYWFWLVLILALTAGAVVARRYLMRKFGPPAEV